MLAGQAAAAPIKLLLLDGRNNHKWQETTPVLLGILNSSGLFTVDVATSPPEEADAAAQAAFAPDFSAYAAVVMHWNDYGAKASGLAPWMDSLLAYVKSGGGLVLHHAAGLEFHPEFGRVAGLVWQKPGFGDRITIGDDGTMARQAKGEGQGSGHGARFEFPLKTWSKDHPICAGLPDSWMHAEDEAWFGQRGPAEAMEVLATARPPQTNANEPMIWTVKYGTGRVVVNRLGHDAKAMACTGFRTVFTRGCEWAATGGVTLPVPREFPTATTGMSVPAATP